MQVWICARTFHVWDVVQSQIHRRRGKIISEVSQLSKSMASNVDQETSFGPDFAVTEAPEPTRCWWFPHIFSISSRIPNLHRPEKGLTSYHQVSLPDPDEEVEALGFHQRQKCVSPSRVLVLELSINELAKCRTNIWHCLVGALELSMRTVRKCGKKCGGLEPVFFFHILAMSSSQLTNSIIFQRGRLNHQPAVFSCNLCGTSAADHWDWSPWIKARNFAAQLGLMFLA